MTTTPTVWSSLTTVFNDVGNETGARVIGLSDGNEAISWIHNGQAFYWVLGPLGFGLQAGDTFDETGSFTGSAFAERRGIGGLVAALDQDLGGGDRDVVVRTTSNAYIKDIVTHIDTDTGAGTDNSSSRIASFADGSLVVASVQETSPGGGSSSDVVFHIVSATNVIGADIFVAPSLGDAGDNARNPELAVLSSGNFVITWEDEFNGNGGGYSGDTDIWLRLSNSSGTELILSTNLVAGASDTAVQSDQDIAALTGGGFVVVWTDSTGDGAGNTGIKFTVFNSIAAAIGGSTDLSANTTTAGIQDEATVTYLNDGGFVIAWEDENSATVLGQRFSATGVKIGTEFTMGTATSLGSPDLGTMSDGRILYAEVTGLGVKQAIFDPRDSIINGDGANNVIASRIDGATIYGGAGNDKLFGMAGGDALYGGGNADFLYGGDATDNLYGDAGTDWLEGGANADTLYGGADPDQLYGGAAADYLNGAAGSSGQGDALYGGEGDDSLQDLSSDFADYFSGGNGEDSIYAGGAADIIYGDGNDDLVYAGGAADTVYGGIGNDSLFGDAGADQMYGDGDNDSMYGGADGDFMYGGGGEDYLFGDLGSDNLAGGDQHDVINSFNQNDQISGGNGGDWFAFQVNFGIDTINDWQDSGLNQDVIMITHAIFANFAAVQAAMTQFNPNTVFINAGGGNGIYVVGATSTAGLGADDFYIF